MVCMGNNARVENCPDPGDVSTINSIDVKKDMPWCVEAVILGNGRVTFCVKCRWCGNFVEYHRGIFLK